MGVYESTTKTSDVRYLTLPAETMQLLRQHKRDQLRLQLANGDRWIHTGYVFTVEHDMSPLADRTVLAYHRLISIILSQAEKEMLVPYNAAAKATPPKAEKRPPTTSSRKPFPKY